MCAPGWKWEGKTPAARLYGAELNIHVLGGWWAGPAAMGVGALTGWEMRVLGRSLDGYPIF